MQKRTTAADHTPIRLVLVTMDAHVQGAVDRASARLRREIPGLTLTMHAASRWGSEPEALQSCLDDIASADIIVVTMLFLEEHIRHVMPALQARRDDCDALVACMSAPC